MSLELSSGKIQIDEKNPLDTDNKLKTLEKKTKNSYNIHIESFKENNTLTPSPEKWVLENNTLTPSPEKSLKENNTLTPSPKHFRLGIPQGKFRTSTIYTNLSSDSSQEVIKTVSPKISKECKKESVQIEVDKSKVRQACGNRPASSIRNSTFALTNRIFCVKCGVETLTDVSFQMKDMNLWGSIGFFLTAIKCCGEPRALSRYQDIVHSCKKCGNIVARISTV